MKILIPSVLQVVLLFNFALIYGQAQFENQAESLGAGIAYGNIQLGAGVSFFDYNNDGLDDITIPASNSRNFTFLKNMGGTFQEENLGIDSNGFQSRQAMWVDFDNDGDNDFFATSDQDWSRLYQNNGDGTFTDITLAAGLPTVIYDTYGAAWGDFNNDRHLDVFFSIRDENQIIPNILYQNNGDGTFTNVTIAAGLETTGYLSFCASFFDMDKDGDQDLYVANDKYDSPNLMYRNNGDGTFTNVSASSGTGIEIDAMSTTIGDYNNDGWLDIYVTNTEFTPPPPGVNGNVMFRNNADGTFTNVAASTGTIFNSVGWGAVFLDGDNEGFTDLYVSGEFEVDPVYLPSAYYENQGDHTFVIPTGIGFENDTRQSYGNAIGDIDNDGYPDIVVMNNNDQNIFLWKNTSIQNHNWLKVKLEGTQGNRMGIGSFIEVGTTHGTQLQFTVCGEGYLGQNSAYEFFGLNDATNVDFVRVTWPSGIVDYFEDINVNQHITIVEGSGILTTDSASFAVFSMYPNPASELVFLNFPLEAERQLVVLDVTGKVVISEEIFGNTHQIDLSVISGGVYIVEVRFNGNVHRKKLIKH